MTDRRKAVRVPPPADEYPEVLERALNALDVSGPAAADQELARIAWERTAAPDARYLSRAAQGRVFQRDGFRCRYCGAKVIPIPIMELLGGVFGDRFPYHPNWKGGYTHPAVLSRTAVVDHIKPLALGGPRADESNLATACWPCNARKADLTLDRLGWELLPSRRDGWDGLSRFYRRLWHAAGCPKPKLHHDWARALNIDLTPPP